MAKQLVPQCSNIWKKELLLRLEIDEEMLWQGAGQEGDTIITHAEGVLSVE